ncbi:zinc finger, CCHC-type containing protein [Tanacetum coccineum]
MVEHNNSSRYNDNKGKRKHHDNTHADPYKKAKPTCWKYDKTGHIKRDCKGVNVGRKANGSGIKGSVDGSFNSLKCQNMFNKYLQVYYVTYVSEAYFVQDDDVAWWVNSRATVHMCKDKCWFKTYESLNDRSIHHMGNKSTTLVHGHGCVYLRLNIVNDNIGPAFMSTFKLNDSILWHARLGHVHYKRMQDMSKNGLILAFDMDTENDLCDLHVTPLLENKKYFMTFIDDALRFCYVYLLHPKDEALDKFKVFKIKVELQQGSQIKRFRTDKGGEYMDTLYFQSAVVRLPNQKLKTLGERGIECIFVGYAEHSKAFRFYVIVLNESVSINSIIETSDAIFDENRYSSFTRPSLRIPNRTEDIRGTRDEVSDQHSYCFNVEDDPKEFDEAMKFQDMDVKTAFLNEKLEKEAPKQWHQKFNEVVLSNGYLLNQANKYVYSKFDEADKRVIICLYVDDMLIFGTDQVQIDLANDLLSSRFSMKDMREADVILGTRNKHESNGITISLSHYIEKHWQAIQRVLKYLKKTMDYRLTYTGYPSVLEGYTDASWISNTEDNSSTSGWVFFLGGGAIS